VSQAISLEQLIRKKTFPKLIGLLLSVLIAGISVAFFSIQHSLQEELDASLTTYQANLDQRLTSLKQEVYNLSTNDLIINALIDFEVRDEYLPVFFRSLQLSAGASSSILFTDFAGNIITTNDAQSYHSLSVKPQWQPQVLEHGETFVEVRPDGIFIAYPVFYAELPEGALLVFLPDSHKVLSSILAGLPSELDYLLLDENKKVLYSSDDQLFETNRPFSSAEHPQWQHESLSYQDFTLVSLQEKRVAYENLIWLLVFSFASLLVVFSGTFVSIRIATLTAAGSIKSLQSALKQSGTSLSHIQTEVTDVSEVLALKHSYNDLISELDSASQSLSKFEGIIHSLNDYLVVTDGNFKLLLSNQQFSNFAETHSSLGKDSSPNLLPAELLVRLSGKEKAELQYSEINRPSAPPQQVEWVRTDYISPSGEQLGYIFVGNDLTENRAIRAELEIKNKAIEEAHTSVVISEYSSSMPITYVNQAFTNITGYSPNDAIGKNCRFLQGKRTDPESIRKVREAITKAEPLTITLLNYRKNGTEFYNELSLSPIRNNKGDVTHILGLQTDVTDAEQSKLLLAEAKARAEESADLKSSFLASMSHEIRTPMNGVLGMLHLLESSPLNSEQTHYASLAKSSADHLLNLIDDILDFSKIEAGKLDMEYIDFDLPELFGDLLESISQRAAERGNTLELDMSQALFRHVKSDPGRLRQVASNLIGNAIKFTENGLISVVVSIKENNHQAASLCCEITDSGIGIEQENLEGVFETFRQADNSTTRKYGGTGLGLSICRQLCELMGGRIWATSEPGQGSRFCFEVALEPSQAMLTRIQLPDLSGYRVLVIDNHQGNATSLINTLNTFGAACETRTPSELSSGVKGPTIIMVDTEHLADEALATLSSLKNSIDSNVHLVAMTSISEQYDSEQQATFGLTYTFPKPATLDDLLSMADRCLHPQQDHVLENGNDPAAITKTGGEPFSRHILLVEDNKVNQLLAKTMLEHLGVEVSIAHHGIDALEQLEASQGKLFDAVFMDCQMPKMDGYEATQLIRAGEAGDALKDISIIAMTANAIKGDREKCIEAGMDDYMSKPIKVDELTRQVDRWLKGDS